MAERRSAARRAPRSKQPLSRAPARLPAFGRNESRIGGSEHVELRDAEDLLDGRLAFEDLSGAVHTEGLEPALDRVLLQDRLGRLADGLAASRLVDHEDLVDRCPVEEPASEAVLAAFARVEQSVDQAVPRDAELLELRIRRRERLLAVRADQTHET